MDKTGIIERVRSEARLLDVHTHVGTDPVNYRRGDFPYAQSAEDLMVRLDRWGVDAAVCFPFLYSSWFDFDTFLQGRMKRSRSTKAEAPYAEENENLCREIYEAYPSCAGRLLPFMFFDPGRAQAEQVENLRRISGQYPVFGLKTATSYLQSHITDLLDAGSCLLDLAAEQNWPLMIHTSVMPGDPWAAVQAILKVVRARPDVRFGLAHTCRFDRAALEAAAALPNCFVDFSAFNIHCQCACGDSPVVAAASNRFPANYRIPAEAMASIAEACPDTMLWGTDSPYYCFMGRFVNDAGETVITQLQCGTDTEINEFRKMPEKVRQRIGKENTLRYLFGENRK
jgi:predicted TIM-barrel fold metal-dependent hydrolase